MKHHSAWKWADFCYGLLLWENFTASTSTDNKIHLQSINWKKCNKVIRSHQTHIIKAIQESRWNRVKALQRLLTHSFSGKTIAVRRVTENWGKRTANIDWETWSTPDFIHNPRSKCNTGSTEIELKEACAVWWETMTVPFMFKMI